MTKSGGLDFKWH